MIIGTGIDLVDVGRFADWHQKSKKSLTRIFSTEEIDYCLSDLSRSAERFAVRFAAREALWKALQSGYGPIKLPFFSLCRYTKIVHDNKSPRVVCDWDEIIRSSAKNQGPCRIHLSLSHEKKYAIAMVTLSF